MDRLLPHDLHVDSSVSEFEGDWFGREPVVIFQAPDVVSIDHAGDSIATNYKPDIQLRCGRLP